ncbi:MAG: hotdog fold thioesterase [Actinomycetales bacterium]|nr:hotdog fold thioesterase [Candidatus Phosphoribacter baldrii]
MTDSAPATPPSASPAPWITAEQVNAMAAGTLHERMGIVFTEISMEHAVARMPVAGNTQPYGLLHGGASVVLAEGVGSFLAVLLAGPGRAAVGVDINATHHRPATSGWVTAVATPIAVGRTTASIDIVITDDEGRRTCSCRFTAQLRDAPPRRDGA